MRVSTIMPFESIGTSPVAPPVKIIYVRMNEVHESIAIELFDSFQHVQDIVLAFHELAFNKTFSSYIAHGTLVCMRKNEVNGLVQEVTVTHIEDLQDREVVVYRPCEALRSLLQQEFMLSSSSSTASQSCTGASRARRVSSSSSSSSQLMMPPPPPCLKRKGRAISVATNDERIHRYAAMLDTMEITASERQLIEDLLRAGDDQMNDALQQYSIHQNVVNLRRVVQGQSKKRYETLEGLSDNFSQLDVDPDWIHNNDDNEVDDRTPDPVVLTSTTTSTLDVTSRPILLHQQHLDPVCGGGGDTSNPFLMGFHHQNHTRLESIPASPVLGPNETNSPARPSLSLSCGPPPVTPILIPKITPATTTMTMTASRSSSQSHARTACSSSLQRLDLSLAPWDNDDDDHDHANAPTFVSIAKLLDQVPVNHQDIHQHYLIGKVLGSGKYSVVKEAIKRDAGGASDGAGGAKVPPKVAVKIIEKYQMMEVRFLKRELEIMYSLQHDGIVQLYELYESPEQLVLVMELCGMELFDHLDVHGPLDEATTKRLIRKLVQTVAYLHRQAVVHRDIKPENILIVGDDVANIKLADFGIARRLEGDGTSLTPHESLTTTGGGGATEESGKTVHAPVRNRLTRAHTKCGTRDYVAPEVMSGKGYGTEADMWSVGIVTFVLMTGYAPVFLPVDGVKRVQFPDSQWSQVSNEMKAFVDALLTRNPEERMTAADALKHCWLQS